MSYSELCNFIISELGREQWWAEGAIGGTFYRVKALPANKFSSRWTCGSMSLTCSHPCRQSRLFIYFMTALLDCGDRWSHPKGFQTSLFFFFIFFFSPVLFWVTSILVEVHFLSSVIPTFFFHLVTIFRLRNKRTYHLSTHWACVPLYLSACVHCTPDQWHLPWSKAFKLLTPGYLLG